MKPADHLQYDAFRAPSRLLTALLILGVVKYAKAKCLVHDGCSELVRKEETTWQATTGFLWGQISRCETILLSKLQQRLVERSGPCYSEKELWELRWLIQGLVIARQGIGAMVKTQVRFISPSPHLLC